MKMLNRFKPSPSMVVAMLALSVALSGTAYAAVKINGKNIKNGTVTGKKLKNGTVTAAKIKKNGLGAGQINEGSLAAAMPNVPSATRAATAGGLESMTKINARQGLSTPETEIYNSGKLRLTLTCDPLGEATLKAYTSVDNAAFNSYGGGSDFNDEDFDIVEGGTTDVTTGDNQRDVVYTEPGGQVVLLQYSTTDQPDLSQASCMTVGMAIVL